MKTLGKYEILEPLGTGGMGNVYRAHDPVLEREVAIKTILTGAAVNPEILQRFYREARAYARLQHPNIVTIYDLGEQEDVAYIVMELLSGCDLQRFIAEKRPFSLQSKVEVAAQICDGLAHAHRLGIVHRDIKPGNIFIDESGHAKILDFGIARLASSKLTRAGAALGTPDYMAPEQLGGRPCDQRSDLFSAAAVFFEFLSFVHPFAGPNIGRRIVLDAPAALSAADPQLPEVLEEAIAKGLEKDLDRRYQTAEEFAAALRRVIPELGRKPAPVAAPAREAPPKSEERRSAEDAILDALRRRAEQLLETDPVACVRFIESLGARQQTDERIAALKEQAKARGEEPEPVATRIIRPETPASPFVPLRNRKPAPPPASVLNAPPQPLPARPREPLRASPFASMPGRRPEPAVIKQPPSPFVPPAPATHEPEPIVKQATEVEAPEAPPAPVEPLPGLNSLARSARSIAMGPVPGENGPSEPPRRPVPVLKPLEPAPPITARRFRTEPATLDRSQKRITALVVTAVVVVVGGITYMLGSQRTRSAPPLATADVMVSQSRVLSGPQLPARIVSTVRRGMRVNILDLPATRKQEWVRVQAAGSPPGFIKTAELGNWSSERPETALQLLKTFRPDPSASEEELKAYLETAIVFTTQFGITPQGPYGSLERARVHVILARRSRETRQPRNEWQPHLDAATGQLAMAAAQTELAPQVEQARREVEELKAWTVEEMPPIPVRKPARRKRK